MKKRRWNGSPFFWGLAVSILAASPVMASSAAAIPKGLSVEGRELAGFTNEEAQAAVEEQIRAMAGQSVALEVQGERRETTAGGLGFTWSNEAEVKEQIGQYENSNLVKRYMLAADLAAEPVDLQLETSVDENAVIAFVQEQCAGIGIEGHDASIIRENGQFLITPEVYGAEADLEGTLTALKGALAEGLKEPVTVTAVIRETQPAVTAQALETIQDVLGSFSTDFSSSGAARATNLSVGAGKINGHVLLPGETLSGYECLQPFTVENGYQTAAAYENGQVVDSIGGGVCQIATTLYNASLLAELEITQRQNHSMSVGYVQPSQDAAIAGTYKDIKVTNNYSTPIYIEGYTQGRQLTFTIYGREVRQANRKIRFESETLSVVDPGMPKEILNPSLPAGTRKQVQSAHRGIKSRLWKVVSVDGVETERILLSTDTYNASPAIVQVGPEIPVVPLPPGTEASTEETRVEEPETGQTQPGTSQSPSGQTRPQVPENPGTSQTQPGTGQLPSGQTRPQVPETPGPGQVQPEPGIQIPETSPVPSQSPETSSGQSAPGGSQQPPAGTTGNTGPGQMLPPEEIRPTVPEEPAVPSAEPERVPVIW